MKSMPFRSYRSGIYQIRLPKPGEYGCLYVGSTIALEKRISGHQSLLKARRHFIKRLQKLFDDFGMKVLKFEILELCPEDQLEVREQYFIDTLKPKFNVSKASRPCKKLIPPMVIATR